jgi:hypothetical protein
MALTILQNYRKKMKNKIDKNEQTEKKYTVPQTVIQQLFPSEHGMESMSSSNNLIDMTKQRESIRMFF